MVGLVSQCYGTGKNYYHTNILNHESSRRNGQLNLLRIRKEENKLEQKQRKYRYLYQVRTAHGDIISQVHFVLIYWWPLTKCISSSNQINNLIKTLT